MKIWKKLLCLALAATLLLMTVGCESSESGSRRRKRSDRSENDELSSVEYEIREADGSWRNDNGDVLVEHIYEQVVLLGDGDVLEKINGQIQEDAEKFLNTDGIYIFESEEEAEEQLKNFGMAYGDLFYNANAEVTHNGDGIFSIHMSTAWFMGGVFNLDHYGMTFDLETGEKLTIAQVAGKDEETLQEELNAVITEYVTEAYGEGLFADPEEILADYELEDYLFYVQDGELIVTFYTYTFAPGAAGATVIPTGITVGSD